FEHDADELVTAIREVVRRRNDQSPLLLLIEAADDAADELEEAAFLMRLLAKTEPTREPLEAVAALTDTLLAAAQEWVKTLTHAVHVDRPRWELGRSQSGSLDDVDDFLTTIDRLGGLEHQADDAERGLISAAVQHARDFRQLHLYAEIGRSLEAGADALKRASLLARDHILGSVLGG
ncbi:MAG: DUF47 family protein, partial [Alphaproteobacteria bacterium]|nr:DUF47 family protein [Alphaproteobacteria bacterium]